MKQVNKVNYSGGIIYVDIGFFGKQIVTTNLHGTQKFKSVRAAKIAITRWG
jgi:hypothetical protein